MMWFYIKKIMFVLLALSMFVVTVMSAMAFQLDSNEDVFIANAGDTFKGSFIYYDGGVGDFDVKTGFPWISFSENEIVNDVQNVRGTYIGEGVSVPYYINIPDDADIGIHRTVIEVSSGPNKEYLNVKISVQNGLFASISRGLKSPTGVLLTYVVLGIFGLATLIYFYMRFQNGK